MPWYVRYKPTKKHAGQPYDFKNKRLGKSIRMKTLTAGPRRRAKAQAGKWVKLTI